MNTCDGKLCPYYQLVLTPPDGWAVDQDATKKNKVQIMVPKGKNYANAPALIYVQVFYHRDKQQSLENFAEVSNGRWRASVKDAKVTELPAVARANGKPGFLRFAFENPSKKQQAYEVGAFGIDADNGRQRIRARRGDDRSRQGGAGPRRKGLYRLPESALIQCAARNDDFRKFH